MSAEQQDREYKLAEESFSTPASFETVTQYIKFPEDLRGKWILDVGAGGSNATLELRRRGASAFALDYRYYSLEELKKSVDNWLSTRFTTAVPTTKEDLRKQLEQDLVEIQKNPPPGADPRLWSLTGSFTRHLLNSPEYLKNARKQLSSIIRLRNIQRQEYQDAMRQFLASIGRSDAPYVAGVAGALPFPDNTFDFTFSLLSVSFFLLSDRDVFIQSLKEVVRVTRKGGEIQLHPWAGSPHIPWTEVQRQNMQEGVRYFRSSGLRYSIETTKSAGESPRLRLFRP